MECAHAQPSNGLSLACQPQELPPVTRSHQDAEDMTPALPSSPRHPNIGRLEVATLGPLAHRFITSSVKSEERVGVTLQEGESWPWRGCADASFLFFSS